MKGLLNLACVVLLSLTAFCHDSQAGWLFNRGNAGGSACAGGQCQVNQATPAAVTPAVVPATTPAAKSEPNDARPRRPLLRAIAKAPRLIFRHRR
jgi:hypothetical protein